MVMNIYTVAFFGHRKIYNSHQIEKRLENAIKKLITENEYVEFLVGRNGDFDQMVSSAVLRTKKECFEHNSSLVLVLPYMTAEYKNNKKSFEEYYDEIEVSQKASKAYYKSAIRIRNEEMIDRAGLIICFVEEDHGGAYKALCYAKKKNKTIINLCEFFE